MSEKIGYVTEEQLINFAMNRGHSIVGVPSVLLFKALDYIESFEPKLVGNRIDVDQELSWPRTVVASITKAIPTDIERAQLLAAIEVDKGVDFFETVTDDRVKRSKVGPIETEFDLSEPAGRASAVQIELIMEQFYKRAPLWVNRV